MNITITGPRSVGKTTISKLVAKKLGKKYISSDEIGDRAMKKYGGLDGATKSGIIKEIIKNKGYTLITDIYKKQKNFVFDLSGGSFTYKTFPKASEKVRKAAKKNSIVIGLLPSRCSILSIWILFRREIKREHFKNSNKLHLFWKTIKKYPRIVRIFKKNVDFIVYTRRKNPEEVAQEIVDRIKKK
jgi:shikimate kinase